MKRILLIILVLSSLAAGLRAQGVYSIEPQPVCWSYNGTDSTLLSILAFNVRDSVGLFKGYVSPITGQYVNTTAGGTFSAGYCCCSTGTSSNVTITDNNDGTYTAIVGTDTTTIYTKADSLYTTQSIAISDTTYLANSVVQDILIAITNEVNNLRSETGCDLTVTQASHGFSVGDLLTQDPNTGVYAAAASDTSSNFPVAYVCEVVDANNFKLDTEGWVSGSHGLTVYRDYFVQGSAGDVDTVPTSNPIFAFRTFTSTLRYFDIPEYLADGGSGTGGSTYTTIASNGLNDSDGGSDVDVELGGTIDKNTTVSVPTNYLGLAGNNNLLRIYPDRIRVVPNTANEATRPLGAAIRKNTAAGSDANVTYTEYGLPYFAPLTFTSHYSVYYESDKTMKWVYWPANGNGAFMNSVLNTSGGSIERTATYGLGGTLTQNTNIYFDSTLYLNFSKDPTVLDTTYEFSLKLDPDATSPTLQFISNVYDSGNSRWNDSDYYFSPDSLSFGLSNSVGAVSSNLSRLNFSRENGLQVYFQNNLTQYIHLNGTDGVKASYGGTTIQIDTSGNLILDGVPNYANNAAADSDGTLPSGGVYTVTAEDRTLRIKP